MNIQQVIIRGNSYPITIEGTGEIHGLCIGIGSLMQRTMSEKFKSHFKLFSSDLYWVKNSKLTGSAKLTMGQIINDLLDVIKQLNLNKPFLLAHSCFGIVALEFAKFHSAELSGLILVASPPCWNPQTISLARAFFDREASSERKANDRLRQEAYAKIKTPNDSCINLNAYEADSARYWADYNIAHAQLEALWEGIQVDDDVALHFFNSLLPQHDLARDMDKISIPVFLAAGYHDYDSIPLDLWKRYPKPKKFTLLDCGKQSGHWPNIESQELFDQEVIKWVQHL